VRPERVSVSVFRALSGTSGFKGHTKLLINGAALALKIFEVDFLRILQKATSRQWPGLHVRSERQWPSGLPDQVPGAVTFSAT